MFRLPSPRGFPAQSNTRAICEHVEDSRKGRHAPARDVDLARLFGKPPPLRTAAPRAVAPSAPAATASIDIEERKLYIPTGRRRIRKKDGQPGSEEKIPFILVTATATVSDGKREFFLRVTNRSRSIFDSRDNHRKPLGDVRAELDRLCPPDVARSTADSLAEWLQPPREKRPRPPRDPAPDPMPPAQPPKPPCRAAVRTMVRLIRDPVLDYLRRPLTPLPEFLS